MRTHIISNQISHLRPQSAKTYAPKNQALNAFSVPLTNGDGQEQFSNRGTNASAKIPSNGRSGSTNRQGGVKKQALYNIFNNGDSNSVNYGNNANNNTLYLNENPEVVKMIPKQIYQDKERLVEDSIKIKDKITQVTQDNTRLKSKLAALEKEALKMEKLVEEIEQSNSTLKGNYGNNNGSNPNNYNNPMLKSQGESGNFLVGLKRSLKESKLELQCKEDEVNRLKKSVKYTRLMELEAERAAFLSESARLRQLLDQAAAQPTAITLPKEELAVVEQKFATQSNLIVQLRRENAQLATSIKTLEDQNYHLQHAYMEIDKRNQREVNSLKKTLQEKEKELGEFSKKATSNGNTTLLVPSKSIQAKKDEVNKAAADNSALREQVNAKQRALDDIERKMADAQVVWKENIEKEKKEYNSLQIQLEQELKINQKLKDKLKISQLNNNKKDSFDLADTPINVGSQSKKGVAEKALQSIAKARNEEEAWNLPGKQEKQRKRVETVSLDSIKQAGWQLNLRLRSKGLDWELVVETIFADIEGETNVEDLKSLLKAEPFSMSDDQQCELVARYCIENSPTQQNWIFLDLTNSTSNHVIKSVLRQVIGPYTLLAQDQANILFKSICETFQQKRSALIGFMTERAGKRDYVTRDEWNEIFTTCDLEISRESMDYVLATVVEETQGSDHIPFRRIFQIFENGQPVPKESIPNEENMEVLREKKRIQLENQRKLEEDNSQGESYDEEDDFKSLTDSEKQHMIEQDKRREEEINKNKPIANVAVAVEDTVIANSSVVASKILNNSQRGGAQERPVISQKSEEIDPLLQSKGDEIKEGQGSDNEQDHSLLEKDNEFEQDQLSDAHIQV